MIFKDSKPASPRRPGNISTIACFLTDPKLGDDNHGLELFDWNGTERQIQQKYGRSFVLPLFEKDGQLYVHGYNKVGFVFVPHSRSGWIRVSRIQREALYRAVSRELRDYNHYIRGEVYGFTWKQVTVTGLYGKKAAEAALAAAKAATPQNPYSVLLEYPGGDTYYAWVTAENAEEAVVVAESDWQTDHLGEDLPGFTVLLVLRGHVDAALRKEDYLG